jgi:hypothetical protein
LDDSPLHQLFDLCHDTTPGKSYKVFLYLYRINNQCSLPFIECVLYEDPETKVMTFPSFSYECIHLEDSHAMDEDSQTNIHFNNACIQYILPFLQPQQQSQPGELSKIYKGFLPSHDTIFAVFDITGQSLVDQPTKPTKPTIAIIDEIVNKQTIYGMMKIEPIIIDFFQEFSFMKYILSSDHHPIELPIQLYHITNNTNTLTTEKSDPFHELIHQINQRSNDPWFGPFYYFSREPTTNTTKRHAVFLSPLEESLNIVKDVNMIDETTKMNYKEKCFHSPMIYFIKDGIEMYCIKSFLDFCEITI